MNPLSERQAQRCEDAKEPKCKCRCNGALHGAKRGPVGGLSMGDPHSTLKTCPRCDGKGVIKFAVIGLPELGEDTCRKCGGAGVIHKK